MSGICLSGVIYGTHWIPTTQLHFSAPLRVPHTLRSVLESGQETNIVQIDTRAVFDRVNHQEILYKLWSVGMTSL